MIAPIFKPFVMVRVPLPSGYTKGEVLGLNEAGQAVGWMHHQSSGKARPFLFDPALISTNPTIAVDILDLATDTDSGIAYAISDADPPIIVGSLYDTNAELDRAASWDANGDFLDYYYDNETPSAGHGINASATVVGMYKDPDDPHSFVIEADETEWNPASTTYSAAQAINASGEVVGWHEVNAVSHAYSWVENTTTDIHPQGWDESGATSINQYGDIAGWVVDDPDGPIPAYWYNTGGFYSFATPFPALGAESMVCGINSYGEMAVTRTDAPGAVIWQVYESADVSFNLSGMSLMPDSTGQIASARAINDNLWMGGGYKATSGSDPVPCLIIPYDVDNDGNPDYREIVNEDEADENGNWLIDWAENIEVASVRTGMRSGMHAPGYKLTNKTHDIGYTQIVRLQLHLTDENFATADDETFSIQGILDDGEDSQLPDFACNIEKWGRVSGDREIAIWLRSSLNEGDKQHDYLPESPLNVDPVALLASIQEFSYRFARCIDYIQMGNEVWSGPGGYKFYASQLSNCWTSGENPRNFLDMPPGCRSAAATKMFDWLDDQMWAVLEGSALAGRPLRIVGPAVTHSTVSVGFASPTGFAAQSVISTSDWCNERQACFDVHVHYESRQEALDAIDQLMDNDQSGTAPWDVPIYRVALEWGPKVDMESDWAGLNDDEFIEFVTPNCGGEPTYANWETFVNDWEDDQFSSDPDFGLADTHESFFLYGFTAVCYGPSLGGTDFEYDMAALHATAVCDQLILEENGFTELEDEYVDVADGRQIANFEPHPSACSSCGN